MFYTLVLTTIGHNKNSIKKRKGKTMKKINLEFVKTESEKRLSKDAMYQSIIGRTKDYINNHNYNELIEKINLAIDNKCIPNIETVVYPFSLFVVFATYKKLYSVSGNNHILNLWNNLAKDIAILFRTHDTSMNVSDSFDNVQETVTKTIDMINYCIDNRISFTDTFDIYRQKRQIVLSSLDITKEDIINNGIVKREETTAVKECYRHVRRYIDKQSHGHSATLKFTYFSEYGNVAIDNDGDVMELDIILYRRCRKYSDIGSFDEYGNYTASKYDISEIDSLINKLELSERQLQIIWYRMSGYGYDRIASLLNISKSSVTKQISRIREKAIAIGFTPDKELA